MDPLRWVAGCAVKVDLNTVVYPTLHNLKPDLKQMGISLGERVDADIFPLTEWLLKCCTGINAYR